MKKPVDCNECRYLLQQQKGKMKYCIRNRSWIKNSEADKGYCAMFVKKEDSNE